MVGHHLTFMIFFYLICQMRIVSCFIRSVFNILGFLSVLYCLANFITNCSVHTIIVTQELYQQLLERDEKAVLYYTRRGVRWPNSTSSLMRVASQVRSRIWLPWFYLSINEPFFSFKKLSCPFPEILNSYPTPHHLIKIILLIMFLQTFICKQPVRFLEQVPFSKFPSRSSRIKGYHGPLITGQESYSKKNSVGATDLYQYSLKKKLQVSWKCLYDEEVI